MSDNPEDKTNQLAGMAFSEALGRLANTDPKEAALVAAESLNDATLDRLLAQFEAAAQIDDEDDSTYWLARALQKLLDYADWDNFQRVIEKAKIACENSGVSAIHQFRDVTELVEIGSGATRDIGNIRLTRFACYLIAQNGDPKKQPVSFAQSYFAVQTRRQEIRDEREAQYQEMSDEQQRVYLREELKSHNRRLAAAARGAGVQGDVGYAVFQNWGYRGLYGGLDAQGIKKVKRLADHQPILEHMGTDELAANLFRSTQTEAKLVRDKIRGAGQANTTHYEVGKAVRGAIEKIGGTMPEALPSARDVRKVQKELRKAGIDPTHQTALPKPAKPPKPKQVQDDPSKSAPCDDPRWSDTVRIVSMDSRLLGAVLRSAEVRHLGDDNIEIMPLGKVLKDSEMKIIEASIYKAFSPPHPKLTVLPDKDYNAQRSLAGRKAWRDSLKS